MEVVRVSGADIAISANVVVVVGGFAADDSLKKRPESIGTHGRDSVSMRDFRQHSREVVDAKSAKVRALSFRDTFNQVRVVRDVEF